MKKELFCLIFILMIPMLNFAQRSNSEISIPKDFCVTPADVHLYRLINEYRLIFGLEIIPMSKSLSYVAHVHVRDLFLNRPDLQSCNLHSWSDKGTWTPCCYSKDPNRTNCMWNKPRELTGYMGNGQELILWENISATPLSAFDQWRNFELTNDLLLNRGRWSEKKWKAIGVAIYEGYASVWFGEVPDQLRFVTNCENNNELSAEWLINETNEEIENEARIEPETTTPRYYLIVGSFKEENQANSEIKRLQNAGYADAKVVIKENNFRISVYDYMELSEAQKMRRQLVNVFKGIWIMEQ